LASQYLKIKPTIAQSRRIFFDKSTALHLHTWEKNIFTKKKERIPTTMVKFFFLRVFKQIRKRIKNSDYESTLNTSIDIGFVNTMPTNFPFSTSGKINYEATTQIKHLCTRV